MQLPLDDDQYALLGMNPGRWAKGSGAWAWELWHRVGDGWIGANIGSCDPASRLHRDNKISFFIDSRF
jgi:hypothetical protein